MDKSNVYEQLTEIFREVLDNDEIVVKAETNAEDIEEWDSLANIQLVVAIEKQFGIKFNSAEIMNWKNVGDMVDCICSK